MKSKISITILVLSIALLAALAAATGIFSSAGPGNYEYQSIRGKTVTIYGKGLYQHMSAEVAVQGIGQDYVTLFIAIPLLLMALFFVRKDSLKARLLLSGALGYFLVTYLFYTAMGMYNALFLVYVTLLGLTFFAFTLSMLSFDVSGLPQLFSKKASLKFSAWFLIFNSLAIAYLWLDVVVPPLLDGSIYPPNLEHYTTLIVQGFDLGLLLPMSFVSGLFLLRGKPSGYLFVPVYMVFLALLMAALTAKIIAMALSGVNVFPVVIIIPTINLIAILSAFLLIKHVR